MIEGMRRSSLTRRYFTSSTGDPYEHVTWELRDARLTDHDGSDVFVQHDVEFPTPWSTTASNLVAQRYFNGSPGAADREWSLRHVINRVVGTIVSWGLDGKYFDDAEANVFAGELAHLLVTQKAAFNSPVWFNLGVPGRTQAAASCAIVTVDDSMDSILDWIRDEVEVFRRDGGVGVNLSSVRAKGEPLSGGGVAAGPLAFMRVADAAAGALKAGGRTRRAAKMVVLDSTHPDIESFIASKVGEENKARALCASGYTPTVGINGVAVDFQNANNSVRLSDAFMHAVLNDGPWPLRSPATGHVVRTTIARDLLRQIAAAAWDCGDPGVQFETTINSWHTVPGAGSIRASNSCSEQLHLDNSAMPLASLNLMAFTNAIGTLDVESLAAATEVLALSLDTLVDGADYSSEQIRATSQQFRPIGIGYANLGAMLMAMGLAYDSPNARATAAAVTAVITGHAVATSAQIAERLRPFAGFGENRTDVLRVIGRHAAAAGDLDAERSPAYLLEAASRVWKCVPELAEQRGVRNSQLTAVAPTGTIGLVMDCDTMGIEPALGLTTTKSLADGGVIRRTVKVAAAALRRLGYSEVVAGSICRHIGRHGTVAGSHLEPEHESVFACSLGDHAVSPEGHVLMVAAVQPLVSSGISKTRQPSDDHHCRGDRAAADR